VNYGLRSLVCWCALLLAGPAAAQSTEWKTLDQEVSTLYRQGKYDQAVVVAKKALELAERESGPDHPTVAQSLHILAGLYHARDQYAAAEPLYKRSLAIREKALGPDHPNVATSLNYLAQLYYQRGQYAAAEPLFKRSLAIREKALGPNHPDLAMSLNNLAALYSAQGQYAAAEPLLKRSLAIWEKALGPNHPNVAATLNNLAQLHTKMGKTEEATKLRDTFQVHILIVDSDAEIQKWVQSPPTERGGDRGRLRTVSKGKKMSFPIIVTGYKSSELGRINFTADLEVVSPSGKVLGTMKKCCGAIQGDPRTPGLVVLNPAVVLSFDPDDPSGTYTVRATVTDGSRFATASESFRVQTGTGTTKEAAQQGETKLRSASGTKTRSRAREDARHCLSFPTNVEIIKCAEKYR